MIDTQSADPDRAAEAHKRGERLHQKFRVYHTLWQSQAEIFYPERADFTMSYSKGEERYDGLYTGEPSFMRQSMANSLGAMIRPRGRDWFRCVARPGALMSDHDVQVWCANSTATQRNIVYSAKAKFAEAMSESDHDYATFGNAVIMHTYNRDMTGMLFRCRHLRNCAWSFDAEGNLQALHEKVCKEPLINIARLFGKDALPEQWKRLLDKPDTMSTECSFTVSCELIDRSEYSSKSRIPPRANVCATYYADEGRDAADRFLGKGYFEVMPYTVRRWMTVSGEPVGRSPCTSVALGDARTLNEAQEALLRGIHMKVDPPTIARESVLRSTLRLEPGRTTIVDDDYDESQGPPVRAIDIGDPRYGMEFSDRTRGDLGRYFLQELLSLPEREMTAYEVGERLEMYIREAAPVFEPMEAENANLMEGVFTRALRQGAFGQIDENGNLIDVPEALMGADISFEFETPLSDALRKKDMAAADQAMSRVAQYAELDPSVLDIVDTDKVSRSIFASFDKADWLRSPEEVQQARAARAQEQAQAQMLEQAKQATEALGNLPQQAQDAAMQAAGVTDG